MNYQIEIKNVPPIKILTTHHEIPFAELETSATDICKAGKEKMNGSFIGLINETKFNSDSMIRPCCPIEHIFHVENPDLYEFEVLQRVDVVSTIHKGEYDKLESAFEAIMSYVKENNLETTFPIRIIYHKAKQTKWILSRNPKDYITELQIPINN